jgi:hypothetical protein
MALFRQEWSFRFHGLVGRTARITPSLLAPN